MAKAKPIPQLARLQLQAAVHRHQHRRWPQLDDIDFRYRGPHAYLDATLPDGHHQHLCRLTWTGHPNRCTFAIWLASTSRYQPSVLPDGHFQGTPQQALDCACGLYLNDPTAWSQ